MSKVTLINADVLAGLAPFSNNYFDSCVCDPPYELGFMGKKWDSSGVSYSVDMWKEVYRVLKPGAHLLAFGGPGRITAWRVRLRMQGLRLETRFSGFMGRGSRSPWM